MNLLPLKKQHGQSIIEVVAVIAIGTILILALVALVNRANSGADFSKASDQAAKLAAEGMEVIKNIKALNGAGIKYTSTCPGTVATATSYTWSTFFTVDVSEACPDNNGGKANFGRQGYLTTGQTGCTATTEARCLYFASTSTESITFEKRVFTRRIFVSDTNPTSQCNSASDTGLIKQFAVIVSWDDSRGSHEVVNTTCLRIT